MSKTNIMNALGYNKHVSFLLRNAYYIQNVPFNTQRLNATKSSLTQYFKLFITPLNL